MEQRHISTFRTVKVPKSCYRSVLFKKRRSVKQTEIQSYFLLFEGKYKEEDKGLSSKALSSSELHTGVTIDTLYVHYLLFQLSECGSSALFTVFKKGLL